MPHRFEVGKPYNADRKIWPHGNQFNWMHGELDLLMFYDRPSRHEIEAVRSGRSEFAVYDRDDLVVLSYRFLGKRADLPWSDAPYQWHVVPAADRVAVPDQEALTPESRVKLWITLVNAMGGLVEALKLVSLSPEVTRVLFGAIRNQAARPYDRTTYQRSLQSLYQRYTNDQLVEASSARCIGGA